jgi:PPOX class probable F420-dependent enzyme
LSLEQFENQQFLNIETFRISGVGVKTPVWFAQDGKTLYVWTRADSGKAKRIRINPDVKIAPSKADGTPLGEWEPAKASTDESPEAIRHLIKLMRKKYGVSFTMFQRMGMLRRKKHTSIRMQVTG